MPSGSGENYKKLGVMFTIENVTYTSTHTRSPDAPTAYDRAIYLIARTFPVHTGAFRILPMDTVYDIFMFVAYLGLVLRGVVDNRN